ncbi:MAG: hypothetical protein AB7F86_16030 [Bdellovibrionales bacterium]
MNRFVLAALFVGFFGTSAHAYYSIMDTGEALTDRYKLTGEAQLLTDRGGGNASARFDVGINEEWGFRGLAGFGKIDMFFGGFAKWRAVEETEDMPLFALNAGLVYVKNDGVRDLILRLEPLASKKFDLEGIVLTPYGSLPIGIRSSDADPGKNDEDAITLQLVAGAQLHIKEWEYVDFLTEIGVELNEAPTYISVGAIYYLQ